MCKLFNTSSYSIFTVQGNIYGVTYHTSYHLYNNKKEMMNLNQAYITAVVAGKYFENCFLSVSPVFLSVVCFCACLSVYQIIPLFACLSVCLCVHQSTSPSFLPYIHPSVRPEIIPFRFWDSITFISQYDWLYKEFTKKIYNYWLVF